MLSPDCGRTDEPRPFRTVEDCVEDCAAAEPDNSWEWAPRDDGTDACAQEWFAVADCMDALTCEEQRHFFTALAPSDIDYSCKQELDAKRRCFRSNVDSAGGG